MLLGRSKSRRREYKLEELIEHLKNGQEAQADILLQSLAAKSQIQEYFKDLHLHTTCANFIAYDKYQTIDDGLYMLLKGEVGYIHKKKLANRQKHKRSKSYGLKDVYSILISQPLTVFQSCQKNCTANEDVYLLQINPEQAAASGFEQRARRRNQLYENHYLSQDHYSLLRIPQSCKEVLSVDLKIHSIFHFANYSFRQTIKLTSPAIVSSGRAKLKMADFKSHQFDQYGVLLPNIKYEVTSSTLSVMIITNHESLAYSFNTSLLENIKNEQNNRKQNPFKKTSLASIKKEARLSNSRQVKEFAKASKQIEKYSIFPSFLYTKKLKSVGHSQQLPFHLPRKKINFQSAKDQDKQYQSQGRVGTSTNKRKLKSNQSQSIYQSLSSNTSTKYSRFSKLKVSPTEDKLLTKIRERLRQNEKTQTMFFSTFDKSIADSTFGYVSQQ